MRDNLELVARPEEVLQTSMDNELDWRTGHEPTADCSVAPKKMANRRGDYKMAPHLPVGSPERAAYFARLRETFCEDWKAAEKEVARLREIGKGDHLYFVRAGHAVKIGRTSDIAKRMMNMQANNHEELDCVLLLRHRGKEESAWHRKFKHCRIRGEWFHWTSELEAEVYEAREANRLVSGAFFSNCCENGRV